MIPVQDSMTLKEYYETPPQHVFDDIKTSALKVWRQYRKDSQIYFNEKAGIVQSLSNHKDNAWFIVLMFDLQNQRKLDALVSEETKNYIDRARGYSLI